MQNKRLDMVLFEKSLAKDKSEAFILVTEGRVFVNGQKAVSPSQMIKPHDRVEVRAGKDYVGRGALKLEAALEKFNIDVSGKICADIGAATGGFTEVLLKRGAQKVYAIDTTRGKLALKLRENRKVIVMEKTDVRDIYPHTKEISGFDYKKKGGISESEKREYPKKFGVGVKKLPEAVGCVTIDVSLISLRNILPHAGRFLRPKGDIVALFKPQYETRDPKILKHGIVTDDSDRRRLLKEFISWASDSGWKIMDWMTSPIRGGEGNVEYLLWLRWS